MSGNNRAYGYDGLGQLTSASGPWGSGSYSYDSLGNLRSKQLGSRTVTLNYDAAKNRLSQSLDTGASGTRTVAYDGRGNVTTLGNLTFLYDMSDQPTVVSGTANGVGAANGNYTYDGNLKRVKSVVNSKTIYNVYDASGGLVHVDAVTDAKTTDYVSGPMGTLARITNGTVTYLHPDHLGSAQSGTNSAGAVAWREQYTPFGEERQSPAANDNLGGFTGHIRDKATGLNYMQARYYDPVIGRFLSVDPVGFLETGEPGMFNRYSYTMNDPINLIDPNGESSCGITGATNYGCHHLESHSGDTAAAAADLKYSAQELGKAAVNLPVETINGTVDIAAAVSPTATVAGTPNIPVPFDNVDPQASATVNTLVAVFGGAKAATKAPAVAGAVGTEMVTGSGAATFGKYGSLFGRGGKTNGGFFNSNDYFRVGYSWDNTAKQDVFRISIGSKKNPDRIKIHLHRFKERLPAKQ